MYNVTVSSQRLRVSQSETKSQSLWQCLWLSSQQSDSVGYCTYSYHCVSIVYIAGDSVQRWWSLSGATGCQWHSGNVKHKSPRAAAVCSILVQRPSRLKRGPFRKKLVYIFYDRNLNCDHFKYAVLNSITLIWSWHDYTV